MLAPVASFLGSRNSFFKNFDAFRSALQPVQTLASPQRCQQVCWHWTCWAKGQNATVKAYWDKTADRLTTVSLSVITLQPGRSHQNWQPISCIQPQFAKFTQQQLLHGALLHDCVKTTLKISSVVNHHHANQYPGQDPDRAIRQGNSRVMRRKGKSSVIMLTCVPGPFAKYQDHTQGWLVGLGSCQL